MAEAHARGRILVLAVACFLGLSGPVAGQAPILVEQRSIPPSLTGELGESDVVRAVAMIRDLGTTFGVLGEREEAAEDRARWEIYQRTYHGAANRLDAMLAGGQITFRDLPETQSSVVTSEGIVLDSTLAGAWQPNTVRINRKVGAGDWADISRLAGILVAQEALANGTGAWEEWSAAHENFHDLVGEGPSPSVQPLLVRFWHIQDKYLADALAESATRGGRAASLSNDMLVVLRRVESIGGWRWRKPLETVWSERDAQARAVADRAVAVPAAIPAAVATPTAPSETAPPRSADFDTLFANPEPAPLVTAAGPVEDPVSPVEDPAGPVEDLSARADIDALYRENSARVQDSQDLAARLGDLNGQVAALAANVAEQGRQLEALIGDIAISRTNSNALAPKALAALTASQSALERRLADLSREVGPDGLSSQVAALKAAMDLARNQSRDVAQRLETRVGAQVQAQVEAQVQERLRTLSREVRIAQRQASELQSKLSAYRPSAAAIEVPLQDAATRQTAFRQAVVAGGALLVLLLAAIAFWVRGARQRAGDVEFTAAEATDAEGLPILMASLHTVDQNALRDELTQLRADIKSERVRADDLDQRLAAELATVRVDTQTVGQGLIDGAARDAAIGDELAGLRQAIEAERARASGLQSLVDELRSSVAAAKVTPQGDDEPERDDEATPEAANHQVAPPPNVDLAERRRAIEALHRGDLPGFEQAFSQLTALPLGSVERIVRHSGGQDLALACRAVGIAKPHLAAILILSRRAQPGARHLAPQRLAPQQLAEAITVFDESSAEMATQALQGWRAAGQ